MQDNKVLDYINDVLLNMPSGWLSTTTHRLDIYEEKLAKTQFLNQFEDLYQQNVSSATALEALPTAYDYIRLGHPLSCVLEWVIAKMDNLHADAVISFSSQTIPILAVLRTNLLRNIPSQINYIGDLPKGFDADKVRKVYGYNFELNPIKSIDEIKKYEGSTIFLTHKNGNRSNLFPTLMDTKVVDFYINIYDRLGSILVINNHNVDGYVSEIQHVRRRETIAMTPADCLVALRALIDSTTSGKTPDLIDGNKALVAASIKEITGSNTRAVVGSSGLSVQYAIMMGLIDDAQQNHPGKDIKFIVPPNCYGGTNDQARRVAACISNVAVVDLPVDGDNDMVQSINAVLDRIAIEGAVPYIIAEIPTNPRVEVPNLDELRATLSKSRKTSEGKTAIDPVFILDQTFCPNVLFLGEGEILSGIRTISYASGSKFPSGGLCTAGYCVGNNLTVSLMDKIDNHLKLCDNEATSLQLSILAAQLPSMNQRIKDAYVNTRKFVNFINQSLPSAKINFVSKELANQGFTPSVFSLDLPTKGNTDEERESYKRSLNLKLINLMINEIPDESKFCVSYGQLKGCYWTIPATSTQGTTKEGDKDYIVRASLSADMDLDHHQKVFQDFVDQL